VDFCETLQHGRPRKKVNVRVENWELGLKLE